MNRSAKPNADRALQALLDKARVVVAPLALALLAAFFGARYLRLPVDRPLVDFKAFACASRAALERHDPYRYASVAPCERAPGPSGTFVAGPENVIPAPVPGYVLLFFAPLAALAPGAAAVTDVALASAAAIAAIVLLWRCLGLPLAATAALVAPVAIVVDVVTGQTAVFSLLGLAIAAAARDRPRLKLAGIALALVQPNVGIASALAVAVHERRMRLPIAGLAVALAVVSVLFVGAGATRDYAFETLPPAALIAAFDPTELGIAWFAHAFGASAGAAVTLGTLTTILGIVAGVLVAGALARRFGRPEILVLVPPAFAVAYASYVHEAQFVLGIPAALALAAVAPPLARNVALGCALLFAMPWPELNSNYSLIPSVVATAALVPMAFGAPRYVVGLTGLATFALCIGIAGLAPRTRFGPVVAASDPRTATTEAVWGDLQRRAIVEPNAALVTLKLPMTAGAIGVTLSCMLAARRRRARV